MKQALSIKGYNNELTIVLPQEKINYFASENEKISKIINSANISIIGNNNHVTLHFDSEESAEDILLGGGFLLIVKGDNNTVTIGNLILRYSAILGMTGLKLIIGQLPGLGAGVSRKADNCQVNIGKRVVINGATIYLQEDNSSVSIGDDSQLSWGIDIWCTDAHTITDLEGNPLNFAQGIEIGKHVWIGKDAKIGKNVKIADNSIVGWGSIVTRKFDEPNVIIAGIPAKVVKRGINWDRKCINKYSKE
ncbi:acyltransferase [Parabacteroides sp. APC149_11_2_Y6]